MNELEVAKTLEDINLEVDRPITYYCYHCARCVPCNTYQQI